MAETSRFLPSEQWTNEASEDELRSDLQAVIEQANDQTNVVVSVNSLMTRAAFVREALHERSMARSSDRIERMTRRIELLTRFVAIMTVVNVVFVAISVFFG